MRVRGSKEQGINGDPEKTAEIALEYAVKEKSKEKFLGHRCDHDGENYDHHSLLDRA